MVKATPLFLSALLSLTVFVMLPFALHAQSDLEVRVNEYRTSIKEVVNYALVAFEEWDQTLLGDDRSKVQAAFDNLKTTSNWAAARLRSAIPVMEGDTSYIFAANKVVSYVAIQSSTDLDLVNKYVVGYSKTEYQSKEYIGIIEDVKREVEYKISKMDRAERELVAALVVKPKSEAFCYSLHAMLPETQAAFSNLKGNYISTTDLGFEKYEATQLFNMAKSGAVYFGNNKPYAEFLMAESTDSLKAIDMMSELATYVISCEQKEFGGGAATNLLKDRAAIYGIEFLERQRGTMEIASLVRRDKESGPFQVYLQFRKLRE